MSSIIFLASGRVLAVNMADFAQYTHQREELIRSDRALRADHSTEASPAEIKADQYIRKLRASENITIWGAEHEGERELDYAGVAHVFPGMEFLTGKNIIMKTRLFNVLSKMPKGGLLHAHLDATVDAQTVLRLALQQPALHVRTSEALTPLNIQILPQFQALTEEQKTHSVVALTDTGYQPNTWLALQVARDGFLGGPTAFDAWAIGAMTINPSEAYQTHNTVDKLHRFGKSSPARSLCLRQGLIRFAPLWEQYIYEFLRSSVEDGISYVEVRINFFPKFMFGEDGQENVPHNVWVQIFDRTVARFRQGREEEFSGARIIYSTLRFITPEELEWYCDDCIALKQQFPHLIAGFDLVGAENVLKPLIYYADTLLRFRQRQKQLGLDIPLILHAGETLSDGGEADTNLYDAILLGTLRIGHGFSLVKHPKLMEICREKNILVETCPISNEILRLTSSMLMHPLPIMMNHGLAVALCSDDPAVFGNMGLSFDFYQVLVASEVTGLIALRELARDSVKYSTLEPSPKEAAVVLWEKQWAKFIDWIGTLLEV
ncbi:Brix domain-containing protein [Mycena indigotica]|uniref:adenosine deaminase n=1 Tax=Mycena indigotica TaxID=2126181 RepID=A0A8H6SBE0_9AGAR|nr:Brix domain-containing protein [Mycena indigotica]KAF7294760.1 Brix domain-containing protein [Mycena indigotica]